MVRNKKTFFILAFITFLISFAYSLPLYIQSSFLEAYVPVRYVGLYIALATAVTLVAIYAFPEYIKKFNNYHTMLVILGLHILGTLLLVFAIHPLTALLFFIIHYVTISLLGINLDVFIEDITDVPHAGRIRATFLTIVNLAILFGPTTMGGIISLTGSYQPVYLTAVGVLIVVFVLLACWHKTLNDRIHYKHRDLKTIIGLLQNNKNLLKVFSLSFSLRLFFAIMVFYAPVYLHEHLGFSWGELGVMFTIMLTPFVFLELPAGTVADKFLGEKEFIVLGLLIMGVSTCAIAFIDSRSFWVWTGVLFLTRVGAALLESMPEIYFFKTIKRDEVDLINLFRDTNPAGWLIGSLIGVAILRVAPIQAVFFTLAVFLIIMIYPALTLKDTN